MEEADSSLCAICLQPHSDTRLRDSSSLHRCIYGCDGTCDCKAALCDGCADARWGGGTPPLPESGDGDGDNSYREMPDQQRHSGLSVRARVFGLIMAVALLCYLLKHKFR